MHVKYDASDRGAEIVHWFQDDEGDNAFHIAADMAKMVRENLHWIVTMLQRADATTDVKNHRLHPTRSGTCSL